MTREESVASAESARLVSLAMAIMARWESLAATSLTDCSARRARLVSCSTLEPLRKAVELIWSIWERI
jgi:hypothetical protein